MKLLPHKNDVALLNWDKLVVATNMVADKTMERADLRFGPVLVKIYAAGTVLRIDIQTDEE